MVCTVAVLAVGLRARGPTPSTSPIVVDYPLEGSLFPPDSVAPAFQWRDTEPAATAWRIDFTFADRTHPLPFWSQGEKMKHGELDTSLVGYVPQTLSPEQREANSWKPDPKAWAEIKKHSVKGPATVTFTGLGSANAGEPRRAKSRFRLPPIPWAHPSSIATFHSFQHRRTRPSVK